MRFVIVGGGVAGTTAAIDLARREAGEIVVYSDEEYPYYYRPQLTEFLAGTVPMSRLLRRPLSWYENQGIDVRLGRRVTALHPDRKTIEVDGEGDVSYDRLLLATGSLPFVPPIEGVEKEGIRTWRTLADTLEMEKAAVVCQNVVIMGGGLLGLEAARGLKGFCSKITVLEFFPCLLPRQLDEEGAGLLQDFVTSLGIEVVVGAHAEAFTGGDRVTGVRLQSGEVYPANTVVVAAGVRANARLAADAGLAVDRGVVVDERMNTSDADVFAAGDVAVFKGYSWAIAPIAQAQARIAAANMAGEEAVYDAVIPSTTLKVVGIDVSSVGHVHPEDEDAVPEDGDAVVFRNLDEDAGTYKKIVLRDGIIVGSIVINDKRLAKDLENRIAARRPMTPDEAQRLIS